MIYTTINEYFIGITSLRAVLSKTIIFHNVFNPTLSAEENFKRSFQAIGCEITEVIIQNENFNNFLSNFSCVVQFIDNTIYSGKNFTSKMFILYCIKLSKHVDIRMQMCLVYEIHLLFTLIDNLFHLLVLSITIRITLF